MSHYKYFNPNPKLHTDAIDCTVRALCAALDIEWDWAYCLTAARGYEEKRMPVRNGTWWVVLRRHGFDRAIIPNTCPDCYTAADFCRDHPRGVYVLGFEGHTAAVRDGCVLDSFDSTDMVPIYYWYRRDEPW